MRKTVLLGFLFVVAISAFADGNTSFTPGNSGNPGKPGHSDPGAFGTLNVEEPIYHNVDLPSMAGKPKQCSELARICQNGKVARRLPNCKQVCSEDKPHPGRICPALARLCKNNKPAVMTDDCQLVCPEDTGAGGSDAVR